MAKPDRVRIDYSPGFAAVEALQAAQGLHPDDNTQALIDRLVITGLSALMHSQWKAPRLWGQRDQWQLPDDLRQLDPENAS